MEEGEKKVEEPMWKKFWVESFTAGFGGGQWVQWEQSYDGGVAFWRGRGVGGAWPEGGGVGGEGLLDLRPLG